MSVTGPTSAPSSRLIDTVLIVRFTLTALQHSVIGAIRCLGRLGHNSELGGRGVGCR